MKHLLTTLLLSCALSVLAVVPTGLGLSNVATIAAATPPAAPGGSDPHWASVTYLVTHASPTPAVVGGTVNYVGVAGLTTSSAPLTYTTSLTLDGSGDAAWLASGEGSRFTGDFTAELWFKPSASANNSTLLDIGANKFKVFIDGAMSAATIYVYSADGGGYLWNAVSLGNIGTSTWRHIAVSRTGSSMTLWFDGVQKGSTVTNSSTHGGTTNKVTLGAYFGGDSGFFTGLIGSARVTDGVGRYTSSFTPAVYPES